MRIMVSGGGTAGHTSPAVAVIQELQKRDPQLFVQWVGRRGAIEERVCKTLGLPFRPIPMEGWPRRRSLRRLVVAFKFVVAYARSYLYIRRFQPQLVVGFGGYVTLPVLLAAQRMGIPTAIHEQNKRLGVANRLIAKKAARIFLSYPETLGDYPEEVAEVLGNPVREGFIAPPDKKTAREQFDLDPDVPVLLVTGGSQGAHSLNHALELALPELDGEQVQIIWLTGKEYIQKARTAADATPLRVSPFPFIDNMASACAAADLIISRAGASSTAEIATLGVPSILVPYPHATDNHQQKNAEAFVEAGAARMILDKDLNGYTLAVEIKELLAHPQQLGRMGDAAKTLAQPQAASVIADTLVQLAFREQGGAA